MTEGTGGDVLGSFVGAVPVSLISTPRQALTTCRPEDRVEDVIRDTRDNDYDYVPVVGDRQFIGVLRTKPPRTGCVRQALDPLAEPLLIGGDAGILDFVRQADTQPYRLVLGGTRICGLVTLSDLQKLPARAALFGLVTHLELALQEATRRAFKPSEWKAILSDGRRGELQKKILGATKGRVLIDDEILYTELCDKLDIIRTLPSVPLSLNQKERLVSLRHQLAHANEFADSMSNALETCKAVQDALSLRQSIKRSMARGEGAGTAIGTGVKG